MTRIINLKMKNYRPFYNTENINFSTNSKKPWTVINAGTGSGKTTILDAISWCLYGKEIHKPQPIETMLNDKKKDELKDGETIDVLVEILLGENEEDIECQLCRKITFQKEGNDNVSVLPYSEEQKAKVRDVRNNLCDATFEVVANRIFPENIQHLFMFDGEELRKFFDENNIQKTRQAIIDITQIDFLETSVKHLKEISKIYKTGDDEDSPEIKRIEETIKSAEREIDRNNIEIKNDEDSLNSARSKFDEIQNKIEKMGIKMNIEEIITKERSLREETDELIRESDEKQKDSFDHLLKSIPNLFCLKKLKECFDTIDEKYESGELPPTIRVDFLNKLLNSKPPKCICGRPLEKGSDARALVERYRDKSPLSDYEEEIRHGQTEIKLLIHNVENFHKQRETYYTSIQGLKKEISSKNEEIKSIEKERKGLNEKQIESLYSQRKFYLGEIERYNRNIGECKNRIEELQRTLIGWEAEKRKLEKESIKNSEMREKFDICDRSIKFFEQIKEDCLTDVKLEIEKITNELFKKGINEPRVSEIQITDDYECRVLDRPKNSIYETLSSGQKQTLTTSFIMALRKESGFDSPILFDYPFGRIDPEVTSEVINSLKFVLENVQVTFLLIRGREFNNSIWNLMKDRTGRLYEINKIKNEKRSEVIRK